MEQMERKYRTRRELIELFTIYACEYDREADEAVRRDDMAEACWARGRAEAYRTAAFEVEHNTREGFEA